MTGPMDYGYYARMILRKILSFLGPQNPEIWFLVKAAGGIVLLFVIFKLLFFF